LGAVVSIQKLTRSCRTTVAPSTGDPAEVRRVDIGYRIAELRRIQYIDCVASNFHLFHLTETDLLEQADIKAE